MTPFRTPYPYAAKGNITHEFDTNHLDIWITFRHPMDESTKPPDNLWTVTVNQVDKPISASDWVDSWTMQLVVPNVNSLPEEVLLAYDGPNANLRTTWLKQWEPWGDLISRDAIPFPYGCFFGNEIAWIQVAAIATWYTVSDADIAAGPLQNITFQNNQELKVQKSGPYLVSHYLSIECSIANKHVLSSPAINNVPQVLGQSHHEFGRANEEASWSTTTILTLIVDDLISVMVSTGDAGNPTLTLQHIGLTIHQLGGA